MAVHMRSDLVVDALQTVTRRRPEPAPWSTRTGEASRPHRSSVRPAEGAGDHHTTLSEEPGQAPRAGVTDRLQSAVHVPWTRGGEDHALSSTSDARPPIVDFVQKQGSVCGPSPRVGVASGGARQTTDEETDARPFAKTTRPCSRRTAVKAAEVSSSPASDAFEALGWGLRHYWWMILFSVVAFGVLAPSLMIGPERYDAQAQVGPTGRLSVPNTDLLPRIALSVFENGTVADAVRESYAPPLSRSTSVIPERVELLETQDNVILTVEGHGETPETARANANVAASSLAAELNKYTRPVGSFAVQKLAVAPPTPAERMSPQMAVALGVLVGLVAGLAGITMVLAWRRPVLDVGSAQRVTGTPVLASLKIPAPEHEVEGLPVLARRVLTAEVDLVFLTGMADTASMRRRLLDELAELVGRVRPVRVVSGGSLESSRRAAEDASDRRDGAKAKESGDATNDLVIVHEPNQVEMATRTHESLLLLVVKQGTGQETLSKVARQHLDVPSRGIVLASASRRSSIPRRSRRPGAGTGR